MTISDNIHDTLIFAFLAFCFYLSSHSFKSSSSINPCFTLISLSLAREFSEHKCMVLKRILLPIDQLDGGKLNENIQKQPSRSVLKKKGVLRMCSKFTGERPCPCLNAISLKLQSNLFFLIFIFFILLLCNVIEIKLRHGCSPVNLLHIFRTPFLKNTSGLLLLNNRGFSDRPS